MVTHASEGSEASLPGAGDAQAGDIRLPLVEEHPVIVKQMATTGRVRVATHTDEVEERVEAPLVGEVVEVTRVPIGKRVEGAPPQARTEGDVTIVPVFEEVLVVEKRLMLKEELHIRCNRTVETASATVILRRQRAEIERLEP